MMKATDLWERHVAPVRRRLDYSWMGAVVAERLMGTRGVVISEVGAQQGPEMAFVEHDEVVEAFPPDGADDALGERILHGAWGAMRTW